MLGVATMRQCPDQTASERARKKYVEDALKGPKLQEAKRQVEARPGLSPADKLRADEALRIAGHFTRGGHR